MTTQRLVAAILALTLAAGAVAQDAKNPKLPTAPKVAPPVLLGAHILIGHAESMRKIPGVTRSKAEARKRAEEALAYARKPETKWADAVAQFSDEPRGAQNGGKIGVISQGQLSPQFAALGEALWGMEVGQVSEIVESPLGFHVLTRLELVEWAAAHVLIQFAGAQRASAKRSKEEALKRAQEVLAKARAGEDFAQLARTYSDGPSGPKGGHLGIFGPGQMVPEFEKALSTMKVGDVSDVIETAFGYHVIKRLPIERIAASHILIQYQGSQRAKPTVMRTKVEARAIAEKVLAELKAEGADFAALARKYSDGPSGPKGGALGMFSKGRMAPAFEQAAFGLEVGGTSGIVETPFGFHIIKRTK